ncbi:MAG TPA: hypothetical protein VJ793_04500 [Anaerolineae bacterium]|nr:hypothetical protein [Anaerolineae bacterium]
MGMHPIPVDVRVADEDVFPSVVQLLMTFLEGYGGPVRGPISFRLRGATAIRREAAEVSGNKFVIRTKFIAMDHSGMTPLGPVSLSLRTDVDLPEGEITGEWDTQRNMPKFPARSVFNQVAVRLETIGGPIDLDPVDVSAEIPAIPPQGATYSHQDQVNAMRAGVNVGHAVATHIVDGGVDDGDGDKKMPPPSQLCCPPPQTLTTEGCLGCIELDHAKGFDRQGIFHAAAPLVELDKILVYVCITNNGSAAMSIIVDGTQVPQRILPGQTSTFAARSSVEVALADVPPLPTNHATGFYVLMHCCSTTLGITPVAPRRRGGA